MGRVFKTTLSILGALTVSTAAHVPLSMAQDYNDPPAAIAQDERLSPRELDSLLAPIALYPDQLLAPLLMAATYPHDVEAAAQWASRPINASLRGDGIAFAIEPFPWDPSVKTLAQFPDVLRMLNEEWDWMVRVGNAFYLQESDVMDSVQRLRHQIHGEAFGDGAEIEAQGVMKRDRMCGPIDLYGLPGRRRRTADGGVERAVRGTGHGDGEIQQMLQQRADRHGLSDHGAQSREFTVRIEAGTDAFDFSRPLHGVAGPAQQRLLVGPDELNGHNGPHRRDHMLDEMVHLALASASTTE